MEAIGLDTYLGMHGQVEVTSFIMQRQLRVFSSRVYNINKRWWIIWDYNKRCDNSRDWEIDGDDEVKKRAQELRDKAFKHGFPNTSIEAFRDFKNFITSASVTSVSIIYN